MEPVDISYWSESSIIAESDNLKRVIHSKYNQVETIFDAKRIIAETTKDVSVMNSIASIDFLKNNLLKNQNITVNVLTKLGNMYQLTYNDVEFLIEHSKDESVLEYILRLFETDVNMISTILTSKNIPKALVSKVIKEFKMKDLIVKNLLSDSNLECKLLECIIETRGIVSYIKQEFLCKNATNPSTLELLFEYCKKDEEGEENEENEEEYDEYKECKEKTDLIKMIASNPNINEKTVKMIVDYDPKRFSEAISKNEKAMVFINKSNAITIENSYVTEHGVYHENNSQAYTVDSVPEEYQIGFIEKISKRSGGIGYHEIPFIINVKFTEKVQKMILELKNSRLNELLSLNKHISYDTLKELAYDNSEITRGNVFDHVKRNDSINKILNDMHCVTGCDELKKLCNLAETTKDKRIHEKIYFFNKDKRDVLCSLAKNEFIDENTQNLLASQNLEVLKVLAANIKTNDQTAFTEVLSSEELAKVQEKFDRIQKFMDEVNKKEDKPIETEAKPIETETKPISSPTNNFKSNLISEIDSSSIRVASRQITKLTLVAVPKKYNTSFFPKILANVLIHGVLENVHSNNQKVENIKSKISQEIKIEAMSMIGGELVNIVKSGIIKVLNTTKPIQHTEVPSLSDGQKLNTVTNTIIDTNSIIENILSKSNK